MSQAIRILDGPVGTQLTDRGVRTTLPQWSAPAIESHPELLSQIHRDYADAGATIHTANTFRTKPTDVGHRWKALTHRAVQIARSSVPSNHMIAGSLSPLADCYRPDLSPIISGATDCLKAHRVMAHQLAESGCDWIFCETFPCVDEAALAVKAGIETRLPIAVGFTAGPEATLITPAEMAEGARRCADEGAQVVMVNCTAATHITPYVQAIADQKLDIIIGAYANAGQVDDGIGWRSNAGYAREAAERYADLAMQWHQAGAAWLGGCCGTSPQHIAELASRFQTSETNDDG
ncbi:MAG: homocysteine S-methyltransferase family protein [Planctomycetota bacterium]